MTQPPYPPPGPYGYQNYGYPPPTQTSMLAVTALVLGILGFASCGPFTAVPAIFVGRSATKQIDASGGRLEGRGMATAGFVLGLVMTAISVVILILILGLLAAGAFDASVNSTSNV